MRNSAFFLLLCCAPAFAQLNTTLKPATTAEFDKYRDNVEAKLDFKPHFQQLKPGTVQIDPANGEGSLDIKDGMLHDWFGAVIVPGATPDDLKQVMQNYASYKDIYKPEVVDSRLVSRNGNRFRVALRMTKTKVFTVVLNGEFDVEYRDLGNERWAKLSRSTRIVELDDDKELAVGQGKGFLWRMNAYWIVEPRPEGLYLECRSLTLSRNVPFGLGAIMKPFLVEVPRESLVDTLNNTMKALRAVSARRIASENPALAQREVQQSGQ